MPQAGQIIPSHLYPHQMVVVNDNTQYTPVVASESDDANRLLFVFSSPKGVDGKVQTITGGLTEFLAEYGQGPFSLYGQPYLNAYFAFGSGNIVGHCLRVSAPNASYSYAVLVALYKVESDGKMTVKFKVRTGDALMNLDELADIYEAPKEVIAEGEDAGFTEVKLMSVASLGTGAYGKKLQFAVSTNTYAQNI